MAHNVESRIWQRYYETETNPPKRWYTGLQWRKFENYERRAFREADRVVAVSHEDAQLISDHFESPHVVVVENGVDTTSIRPLQTPREAGRVLFLGSLDWRPNLDAVEQLLSTVFPAVRARMPIARLCIVGRNPSAALQRRCQTTPGVELHADVADVRPFLAQSALLVVPLRIGGGSRLKILEAFAAGLPVVSTRVGAEGLRVDGGVHLVLADDVDSMAAGILGVLQAPDSTLLYTERARRLVEDEYDWEILAGRLGEIWDQTAESEQRQPNQRVSRTSEHSRA
jgi:glycosyltransferase involved in cell wall biosynthesis